VAVYFWGGLQVQDVEQGFTTILTDLYRAESNFPVVVQITVGIAAVSWGLFIALVIIHWKKAEVSNTNRYVPDPEFRNNLNRERNLRDLEAQRDPLNTLFDLEFDSLNPPAAENNRDVNAPLDLTTATQPTPSPLTHIDLGTGEVTSESADANINTPPLSGVAEPSRTAINFINQSSEFNGLNDLGEIVISGLKNPLDSNSKPSPNPISSGSLHPENAEAGPVNKVVTRTKRYTKKEKGKGKETDQATEPATESFELKEFPFPQKKINKGKQKCEESGEASVKVKHTEQPEGVNRMPERGLNFSPANTPGVLEPDFFVFLGPEEPRQILQQIRDEVPLTFWGKIWKFIKIVWFWFDYCFGTGCIVEDGDDWENYLP
jgi:hypothetical protein